MYKNYLKHSHTNSVEYYLQCMTELTKLHTNSNQNSYSKKSPTKHDLHIQKRPFYAMNSRKTYLTTTWDVVSAYSLTSW